MKTQGLFNNFTREGVSSNLDRRSENERLTSLSDEKERGRGHPLQRRPVAAMAGSHSSPENFGSNVLDHR
jgi:hypothetical protein